MLNLEYRDLPSVGEGESLHIVTAKAHISTIFDFQPVLDDKNMPPDVECRICGSSSWWWRLEGGVGDILDKAGDILDKDGRTVVNSGVIVENFQVGQWLCCRCHPEPGDNRVTELPELVKLAKQGTK